MTITRNQRENTEALSTTEHPGTLQRSQPPSEEMPTWGPLVLVLAQDKRHDLTSATLRFWKVKLAKYSDELVSRALMEGVWDFFPSVDSVIQEIGRIQESLRIENADKHWGRWKSEQERAHQEGLLASEEDYEHMRAALKDLAGKKDMTAVVYPETVPIPTTQELAEHLAKNRAALKAAGINVVGKP